MVIKEKNVGFFGGIVSLLASSLERTYFYKKKHCLL